MEDSTVKITQLRSANGDRKEFVKIGTGFAGFAPIKSIHGNGGETRSRIFDNYVAETEEGQKIVFPADKYVAFYEE